ncbi:lysophospholipid acyltransferase family protein [Pueribacillus sp. YX66]|uniref:lysophospholipid acyltransferase family protein n=1 Tax=Pueribacillus sp. YX66 TaxID=3229242 RepID=UPI00358D3986
MYLYHLGKVILFVVFKIVFRLEVIGKENIPKQQGVLLCSNHISNFDPPILGVASPRIVRFMAKQELFHNPFLNWLLIRIGGFPVKRGLGDKQALRTGLELLNNGEVMGIFPEGTRSKTGKLGKGLAGAGFFALRSNAVVIPCAIVGTYKPFKKIKVIFGKQINFNQLKNEKRSAKEGTEVIMHEIRKLLEKERRNI